LAEEFLFPRFSEILRGFFYQKPYCPDFLENFSGFFPFIGDSNKKTAWHYLSAGI